MAKQLTGIAALLFFLWFDIGCLRNSTQWIPVNEAKPKTDKVLIVIQKTGETFNFKKEAPGTIQNSEIVGEHYSPSEGIDITQIQKKQVYPQPQTTLLTMNDGRVLSIENAGKIGNKIYQIFTGSIPLSQIRALFVIRPPDASVLIYGAIVLAIIVFVASTIRFDPYFDWEY